MPVRLSDAAPSRAPALPARLYARDTVQGLVPRSFLTVLAAHLQAQGVPPAEVMPAAMLLQVQQGQQGVQAWGRIPAEVFCQLLIAAAERLQDPLLGLHLGQSMQPSQLGALGYVLLASEHLGAALMRIQRYHRLVHDINPIEPALEGDQLVLRWGVAHGKPGALFDEMGIAGIVQFGRALCSQALVPTQVDFVNPAPPSLRPYTRHFGCPVRFGQAQTRLAIPLAALAAPLRQPDPTLLRLMEAQVDATMAQLPQTGDLAEATRKLVAHLAPQGMPELAQVAQAMRLSPRVFYRRLAEQGLNFRTLRDTALQQLAELHLRDERLTLADVGALLGYAEQSAFTRAFKRWTGVAPLQWRQHQAS